MSNNSTYSLYLTFPTHTLTMEYHSPIQKNEILLFAATWMKLEGIILSETNQRKTMTI